MKFMKTKIMWPNEKPFSVDLYPYLNLTRRQIIELALDKEIITSVGNYLKTPILAKVMVYLNIPRENTKKDLLCIGIRTSLDIKV